MHRETFPRSTRDVAAQARQARFLMVYDDRLRVIEAVVDAAISYEKARQDIAALRSEDPAIVAEARETLETAYIQLSKATRDVIAIQRPGGG